MRLFRFTALAFAALCLASVAEGQNLVSNPGFDNDVTGWPPFATASIAWSSLDAVANPASGSAVVTNFSTTPGDGTGARQCIEDLVGGLRYRIAAAILVPGGQSNTGSADLLVQWYDQPGCNLGFLGLFSSPAIMSTTPDVWYTSVETGEAPPGSQSARLRLSVRKEEDSGSLDAHFDNVEFEGELIFVDDFESGDTSGWVVVEDGRWHPPPGTSWQWQLTGTIDTSFDVEMYDIDLFDAPAATISDLQTAGRAVICYFSAGSWEDWRPDAGAYPPEVLGNTVGGWPGERWVDIRRLDLLGPILEARLDLAKSKGCTGVEPDNVDAYQNDSGFPLQAADQLAFNRWLATQAQQRALSVGLKNDLDQVPDLVGDFDWALDEQCYEYAECDLLQPFIDAGKAVFGVEYEGDELVFCPYFNALNYSWMKKDLDLGAWRIDCRDIP